MDRSLLEPLRDFGTRSVIVHALMAATFVAAVAVGLLVEGRLGLVSFVAFLNFTAGLWIAQLVHSLGNTLTDDDYEGLVSVVVSDG